METSEYQARVVGELRRRLLDSDGRAKTGGRQDPEGRVWVEEVRLGDPPNEGMVVVLYRDVRRPECLFGWRMEAMEPADDPEIWTTIVWANFWEHVIGTPHGLPGECSGQEIT